MRRITLILLTLMLAVPAEASAVRVVDGDTIEVSGTKYRLHGIDAPEAGQKCKKRGGGSWRCGKAATRALEDLVAGRAVRCDDRGRDDYDRTIAVCHAGEINLNETLVREGHAWAFRKYSTDYLGLEDDARNAGIGIWQAPTETAWDYRARRWRVAEQAAPKGCPIKSNISRNGRIYHAPWSPWYSRTKINLKKGERWFCSEREALDAGWRAPYWGR